MSTHFHRLQIAEVKRETADTVSIALSLPNDLKEQFSFHAGQYLTFKQSIGGEEVRRSYSICSTPSSGELRVAVKEVPNGTFSTFANRDLKTGDTVEVMLPEGNFTIEATSGNSANYVFYAAGSGITPVLSMVQSILETESDSRVFLYYGNKSTAETIFKSELDALNEAHSNFSLTYLYSREDSGDAMTNGRIDEGKCSQFYNQELTELKIEGVYCCGPLAMIETIKEFYLTKGLLHKVHFELFTAPETEEAAVEEESVEAVDAAVTVIIDDEEYSFELSTDGVNILQAAQDADADVPFSCKGGVCCTCKAKVMEGSAKMTVNFALDPEEVDDGFILTCQAHPTSKKVVVSYDEY